MLLSGNKCAAFAVLLHWTHHYALALITLLAFTLSSCCLHSSCTVEVFTEAAPSSGMSRQAVLNWLLQHG